MKLKHGGARRNAGRKTEVLGERMKPIRVTLDERTMRLLKAMGNGVVSKGIRVAANIAYDEWQKK